jgi:hypothetical protein
MLPNKLFKNTHQKSLQPVKAGGFFDIGGQYFVLLNIIPVPICYCKDFILAKNSFGVKMDNLLCLKSLTFLVTIILCCDSEAQKF